MTLAMAKVRAALGEFGRFQKRTYCLIVVPAMFCAMSTLSHVFLTAEPRHRCHIPGCDDQNPVFDASWVSEVIPPMATDPKSSSQCESYNFTVASPPLQNDTCVFSWVDKTVHQKCPRRVFDPRLSTVVSEWDLTCEEAWMVPISQSVFFLGILVGSFLFGFLGDLLGRRTAFGIAILGMGTFGSAVAASPNYTSYMALRFLTAMCNHGTFMISFVLGMELVGASKRTMCGILIEYVFAAGEIILAGLAYGIRRWRYLQLVISAPVLLCFSYFALIPESIDWLLAEGKYEKAIAVIEWAERVNGVSVPADTKSELVPSQASSSRTKEKPASGMKAFRQLLSSRILVIRALIVFYLWCVVNFVYYGLSLNTSLLGDDLYFSFFLVAAAEIPGYTLAWGLMERWGRKPGMSFSLALGGVAVIINGFVEKYQIIWLSTLLYVVGKCGGTSAFGIVYVYTAELFPTTVRGATLGTASMFSRLGAILAPFVITLAAYWDALPMFIFGALCLIGAALSLLLAETRGCALPQSIPEAENIGRTIWPRLRPSLGTSGISPEEEPLLD